MELLALGGLVGVAALSSNYIFNDVGPNAFDFKEQSDLHGEARETARDIKEAGDIYWMQGRPFQAANAQLQFASEWYIPMSNPTQEPTYDINDVIQSRAMNTTLLESQAPRYIFDSKDTLGISYGAAEKNNGYNIGVPYPGISFQWDPDDSLAKGAKVFVDRWEVPEISQYTNRYRTAGGEPTMNLRAELPDDADVPITDRNPYGPIGYYMAIMRNRLFEETARNKDQGIRPTILNSYGYKKPWRVHFNQQPQPSDVYA